MATQNGTVVDNNALQSTLSPTAVQPTSVQAASTTPTVNLQGFKLNEKGQPLYGSPQLGYFTDPAQATAAASTSLDSLNKSSSSGIVSSTQAINNGQQQTGQQQGTSALMGGQNQQQQAPDGGYSNSGSAPSGGFDINSIMQNLAKQGIDVLQSGYATTIANSNLAMQQINLSYDSALAQASTQYSQDYALLQQAHQNSIGAAVSQIATADPFGVNASSSNTDYVTKINTMYTQQATFLSNAYNAQQTAMKNGEIGAALNIQQQINEANQKLKEGVVNLMSGIQSSLITQYNTNRDYQLKSMTQFRDVLNQSVINPGQVTNMSDQDIANTVWGQAGAQAGLSIDQIRQQAMTPTVAGVGLQLKAQEVGIAGQNANTNALRAQIEYQKVTNPIQVANSINSIPVPQPGNPTDTWNYYKQVVGASGQSITPTSQDTIKQVTTLSNSLDALSAIKGSIGNMSNDSSVGNTVASYFPFLSTKVSSFQGAITAIGGEVDKSLGNTNTSTALSKILSAGDTPKTRQTAYNFLMSQVAGNTVGLLTSAARGSQNVSGYSSLVDKAYAAMPTVNIQGQNLIVGQTYSVNGGQITVNADGSITKSTQ